MISEKNCCVYVQPPKTLSAYRNKIYKHPTIPIECETTYKKSYLDYKTFKPKFNKCENKKATGIIDFNTTSQLSYTGEFHKPIGIILPRNHLKCEGSGDFTTTYLKSYFHSGLVNTLSIKPKRGKLQCHVRIDSKTITTESFQNPGKLQKPHVKRKCSFVSSAKIENLTVNRLSFTETHYCQMRKSCRPKYRPILTSSKFEANSIYKLSYKPPGYYL